MAVVSGPRPRARVKAPVRTFEEPRAGLLERTGLRDLDLKLGFAALAIVATSIFVLGQATADDIPGQPLFYVIRQAIYAIVGISLMLAVARVDYSRWRELRVGLYTLMIGSIALVFLFATATRGARSWIEFGIFNFQPSELGKVLLVLTLAAVVLNRANRGTERQRTLRIVGLGMLPAGLVFLQPDLGSALVYGIITLAILFIAGTDWKHFAVLGAVIVSTIVAVLVVAPAVGQPILDPYQEDRLTTFLSPDDDTAGAGYQINQSLIAVGSGAKTGLGDDATQTQLGYLPERHTDFIFAVVGERYGFLGAAFVLSLFALLIWRALRIMMLSKNLYGALIAGSIAAMLLFHVFVNVGMNIGISPITGIPLPLLSFGGSSMISTFLAIGLLQSVYIQSRLASRSGEDLPLR